MQMPDLFLRFTSQITYISDGKRFLHKGGAREKY
jgi:hypothetical protein